MSLYNARHIANSNEDLQYYKGMENACDVKFDDNGDIVLNYNTVRETGCAIDLITESLDFMFEFKAILSNDNKEIKECLQPMSTDGFNANLVPFAYSIGSERFEKLKEGPYEREDISCDKKDECIKSGGECLKPVGLEFGWAYNEDKVHVGMQPVGEPVVCQFPLKKNRVNNLKSEIDVHVDDHISWFRINNAEKSSYLFASGCKFVCLNELDELIEENGLIKPITWRLRNRIYEDFFYNELLVFYLLPQKASFQRDGNNIKRNSSLVGPNCKIEIKFSGQEYKLLKYEKEETTTKGPTTKEPKTKKSTTKETTTKEPTTEEITTEEPRTEEPTTKGTKTEEIEATTKEGTAKETWSAPTSKPLPTSLPTSIRPKPSPTSKSDIFVTVALIAGNVILFVIIVSGLIWFCFCREDGNNEEKK